MKKGAATDICPPAQTAARVSTPAALTQQPAQNILAGAANSAQVFAARYATEGSAAEETNFFVNVISFASLFR